MLGNTGTRRLVGVCLAVCLGFACGAEKGGGSGSGSSGNGNGSGSGNGNGGSNDDFNVDFADDVKDNPNGSDNNANVADAECGQLNAVLRDFKDSHDDFQNYNNGQINGMVNEELDGDRLPTWKSHSPLSITSQDTFSQWYRDVPDVNQKVEIPLNLVEEKPGVFAFQNNSFFPLDGKAFGNQDREHNFHFTTEIRGRFKYMGGEEFTFRGDDDVWVFVNGKLGLDIGGVHGVVEKTLNFDDEAARLEIEVGQTYSLDIFHAERHTTRSNFRMETSIECLAVTIL